MAGRNGRDKSRDLRSCLDRGRRKNEGDQKKEKRCGANVEKKANDLEALSLKDPVLAQPPHAGEEKRKNLSKGS